MHRPPTGPESASPPNGSSSAISNALNSGWNALTLALNSLNRSMGMKDAYPFVRSPKVLDKLRFVHELIQRQHKEESPHVQAA